MTAALGLPGGIAYMAISTKRKARLPGEWLDYSTTHKINVDSENDDYDYQPDAPYRKKKS